MANINTELEQIRKATYGREVRGSIANAIELINKEQINTSTAQTNLDGKFNQLIINAGNSNAEVVAARVKADGTQFDTLGKRLDKGDEVHNTLNNEVISARTDSKNVTHKNLKARLDNFDSQLFLKANKSDVAKISSGTPLFANGIAEMKDITKNYVNLQDGFIYIHNGTAFENSNVKYQEKGLSDRQVTPEKTTFINKIKSGELESNITEAGAFTRVGQLNSSGVLNSSITAYISTDLLSLEDVEKIFRYVNDGSNDGKFLDYRTVYYKEDKSFLSFQKLDTNYEVVKYNKKFGVMYTIPNDAKYVAFSMPVANLTGSSIYNYALISYSYDNALINDVNTKKIDSLNSEVENLKSKLIKNKVIVNFGDSLFGNFQDITSISNQLSLLTGYTVYNCGFGGCRMANRGSEGSQTETDIAWSSYGMVEICDAIISKDFTKQDKYINYGSTSGNTIPSYFANTLAILKKIDFNNVDIVTIEYGTNDYTGGLKLDNDVNRLDKFSFGGALRYVLKQLQSNFPHIEIIVVSPLWRSWENGSDSDTKSFNTGTLIDYVNKEISICNEYKVPLFQMYYESGMCMNNRHYFWDAPDYTHPNEKGRKRYAQKLAWYIK